MSTIARVATVCQNGAFRQSVEENRDYVLDLLNRTLSVSPDLVCLPETFATVSLPGDKELFAEPVPGPTTDAVALVAKEHRCYVICPIVTKRAGRMWNSAVIIGRDGSIEGIYDKRQPVTTSRDYTIVENGVTPGPLPTPVFDLDFGRIGVQICFDAGFPESWQDLADAEARLVFWPSAYNGGFPLRAYAWIHHFYVVTSVRTDSSRIIDPLGRELCRTDQRLEATFCDINLDYIVSHWDFNHNVPERIRAVYGDKIIVRSDRDSAHFLVEPTDPSITVAELKKEFGFESTAEYHARHRLAYAELREGRSALPQNAAHGDRPQHSR